MLRRVLLLALGRRDQPGRVRAALSAVQPQGRDCRAAALPGHHSLDVRWGESTSLPRLCEESRRSKSTTPLALPAASPLSPEKRVCVGMGDDAAGPLVWAASPASLSTADSQQPSRNPPSHLPPAARQRAMGLQVGHCVMNRYTKCSLAFLFIFLGNSGE